MDLDELIHAIDIVEYIGQYVDLVQRGEEYWGLSPFKEEKTPSFSVRRENRSFMDFASGLAGNVFTFTKNYFNCSPRDAVNKLQEYVGTGNIDYHPTEKLQATKLCKKYTKQTTAKKEGGVILPDNYMDKYEFNIDMLSPWIDEGISVETLREFGVRYDWFTNRIVYPIYNLDGKIVNIGSRTLDPDWKAKGLRKYSYDYKWGTMSVLYGLWDNIHDILRCKEVIIFEGCKSVLIAHTWGIKNCAAALTSHISPTQVKILAKLGCRVVIAFDKDVDITKDRNLQKLKHYVNVEYIKDIKGLLSDKDSPVDKGSDIFDALYNNKIRL